VAQKFTVPISVRQLSSAASDGISIAVDGDTDTRIKIEAGGRISWGTGSVASDTNLYRSAANSLKTDDVFEAASGVVTLTSSGAPTSSIADGAIAVDTDSDSFYFRSGGSWIDLVGSLTLGALSDVSASSPADDQILQYNSSTSQWEAVTFNAAPAGGSTGQVLTKDSNSDYNYSWQDVISADGGSPTTWLRAHVSIDAGGV
jgi:hypothetical protein